MYAFEKYETRHTLYNSIIGNYRYIMTSKSPKLNLEEMVDSIKAIFGYDIRTKNRHIPYVRCRMMYSFLAYELKNSQYSLSAIGQEIGYDHASIIHNIRKFKDHLSIGDPASIEDLTRYCKNSDIELAVRFVGKKFERFT